jgi:LPXTG-motif cell wall-anchored protein
MIAQQELRVIQLRLSWTKQQAVTQVSDHTQATSSKAQQESDQKLPQTDQQQETMLTVIGLALMSMLGLLGIGKKSRRN